MPTNSVENILKRIELKYGVKTINGNVYLEELDLTDLPDLSDVTIYGDFVCNTNNLTALQGCPQTVNGHFECCFNNLTSLEYCPKVVI